MATTIKDVARQAGVSTATVSKVMNNNPSISEATAEHVRGVMRELEYHPNVRARNFARQATKTVLFATELKRNCVFENPHIFEIMIGLQSALEKKNYELVIVNVNKGNCMEVLGSRIAGKSVDAVVLHISVISKELEKIILREDFPHIVLGCPDYRTQLCWIDNNNVLSGEMAAKYLLDRKYRRIAFIGGYKKDIGSADRLQGYMNVLEQRSMPVNNSYIQLGESTVDSGRALMKRLLDMEKSPDGVICANNMLAFGALKAAKAAKLKLPMELGIITFDAYPFTQITNPRMTTIDIDVYDMGKQAGEIIIKKIRKPNLQIQSYTTLASLIENGSTL